MAATEEDLEAIPSVGPKIAASVVAYFANESNRKMIEKLRAAGVRPEDEGSPALADRSLAGLRFVVTGRLEQFSRSEIEEKIKQLGGAVGGSVSGRTDYLVAGEDAGSKLSDAQRREVPIVNEQRFLDLVEERRKAEGAT